MVIRQIITLIVTLLVAATVPGQVLYPEPATQAVVTFRYRLSADLTERIRQYRAMMKFLEELQFTPEEREDADLDQFDPTAELLSGTMPMKNAGKLLADPRIITVQIRPDGWRPPEEGNRVEIRLTLAGPLAAKEQRLLHEQVARQLRLLNFQESVGYDSKGYTQLRGSLPLKALPRLLYDLRYQPSGWFLAEVPQNQLPMPLRAVVPIRLIELLPPLPPAAVPPPPVSVPAAKLSDDLQAILADPALQKQPLRVEAILSAPVTGTARDLRFRLFNQVGGATLEGLIGVVASIHLRQTSDLARLAEFPNILAVRTPRAGHQATSLASGTDPTPLTVQELLRTSRVGELHRLGYRGEGVRMVIIGRDFPDIEKLIADQLPSRTRLLDLTQELTSDLKPYPPSPGATGTLVAITARATAPAADITLVRVDSASFHQLLTIAKAVVGRPEYSEAMLTRSFELVNRADELQFQRDQVTEEYRQAFANLSDEEKPAARRAAAAAAMKKLLQDERELRDRLARLSALKTGLEQLAGANIVINTLVWESGYPLDGLNDLSQFLDRHFTGQERPIAAAVPTRPTIPVWVQAGSDALGRVWGGPFRDHDGNGVMEFAGSETPIPAGRWTRELNFLRFLPETGKPGLSLPAGIKIRFTIQWREPHPREQLLPAEPAFPMSLRLLRQLDPMGTSIASDELRDIARSTLAPVRILKTPESGVYEQSLDVTIPEEGVYALRVEGGPAVNPDIPPLIGSFELNPRIVIDRIDPETATPGRVQFDTFIPQNAGVAMPGDAHGALTIGVGLPPEYAVPQSLTGAGPGLTLATKPDLLTSGIIVVNATELTGPGIATGFAGGAAAVIASTGARVSDLIRAIGLRAGGPLILPESWMNHVRPRSAKVGSER